MSNPIQGHTQATSATRRKRPDSPYHSFDDSKYGKRAHCVYFYYVKPIRGGQPVVKSYYYDNIGNISKDRLLDIVVALAHTAVLSNQPPPNGTGFNQYEWKRRSYIAVLIDDPDWKFSSPACEFEDNISLYNCKHNELIKLEGDGPDRKVPLFYCINHMKQTLDNEDDLHGPQNVRFKIFGTTGRKIREDSVVLADGTNLGPPAPPPKAAGSFWSWLKKFLLRLLRFIGL